jgi:preprotein translocase subunit YajC
VDKYFPLILIAALFVGMVAFTRRNKQRAAAADALRQQRMQAGSEVMTTSGLYGTVVSVNPDGTALLSIAAGVEVKWAIAALREVSELPDQYRTVATADSDGTDSAGARDESGPDQV